MQTAFKSFITSIPVAVIASVCGYFIMPWLGLTQLAPAALFATGIALGIILYALIKSLAAAKKLSSSDSSTKDLDNSPRKTIFVGNLAFRASPRQLRELFEPYGTVHSVRIATDRETRKPRGFGFIEMNENGADQAIQSLHGHSLCNRDLNLSVAKQRDKS